MTADEKQKWLREQLDVVTEAIQDAKDESFYGDIPELTNTNAAPRKDAFVFAKKVPPKMAVHRLSS